MSEENVEIVRRVYDAVARRDTDAVLDLYDPEIEWRPWQDLTGRGVYRGHDDLKTFYREWLEAWGDYDETYEELIDAGDHVVVVATGRGHGQASGAEVAWTQYGTWTIRDGRIIKVVWFPTLDKALKAAGLSEQARSKENIELAYEVIEAIKSQDTSALIELTDPEVEWYSLVVMDESDGYRGHDGIRKYVADIADALEFIYAEIDDAISVGQLVLLVGRFHYRGKASGVDTKSPGGFQVRFRDGRVIYMRAFRDPEKALEAVGLSE